MMRALTIQMIFVWAAGTAAAQIPVTSKLKDFEFEFEPKRPHELTFGRECSTSTPCNVRFNQLTRSITNGGTVVLNESSRTGQAFAYITRDDDRVYILSNLSIKCTGCIAVPGVPNFPANTIPLWTWTTSVAGVWDRDGGVDRRAFESAKVITPGLGIQVTDSPDSTTIAVDTAALQLLVHNTPTSSSAACAPGAIWSDDNYIYVCVASGTIKRAALSTF